MIPVIVWGSIVLLVLIIIASGCLWLRRDDQLMAAEEAAFWGDEADDLLPLPEPDERTLAALDAVDALIEDMRQQTIVDPRLPDWVAEVLGCDSVGSYIEKMTRQLVST